MIVTIKIKSRASLTKLCALLLLLLAPAYVGSQEANVASPNPVEKGGTGAAKVSLSPMESQYDFGVVHHLDNSQAMFDLSKSIDLKHNLPGIKHLFTLSNDSEKGIIINSLDSDYNFIQGEVLENGEPKSLPYVVKPKSRVVVMMAFDYYEVQAGQVKASLSISQKRSETPLAVLWMGGTINGPIEVSPMQVDFGTVTGEGQYREITLKFDRRITQNMLPERVKLITNNPYISVENVDSGKSIMGIKVGVDTFQMPSGFKVLPKDFNLKVRLNLKRNIPQGPIKGEVNLLMIGFPLDEITRGVKVSIKGEVVKH